MKKITYISGTRADFGLMQSVLKKIDAHPYFSVEVIATGMHFMSQYGYTINEVHDSGLSIRELPLIFQSDRPEDVLFFASKAMKEITVALKKTSPDFVFLLGDRIEMLVSATAGMYLNLLNVHFHGGDISGTVDETARHAITKLSHIHFTATEEAKKRVIKLGEVPEHVIHAGAPGLEDIEILTAKESIIREKYLGKGDQPSILFLLHPDINDKTSPEIQIESALEGICHAGLLVIALYPNADPGSHIFLEKLKHYTSAHRIILLPHVARNEFLGLLKFVDVIAGNSSAGIIEAGVFGTPVLNIGSRQKNRIHGENVYHAEYDAKEIRKTIQFLIENTIRIRNSTPETHPYGSGEVAKSVIDVLNQIQDKQNYLQKQIVY